MAGEEPRTMAKYQEYVAKHIPGALNAIQACLRETNITSLDIGHLDLSAGHLKSIFNLLPGTHVTELSAEMTDLRKGMPQCIQQLQKSNVTKLNFAHCTLLLSDVQALMQGLEKSQVKDLNLCNVEDNDLSPSRQEAAELVNYLLKSHLTHLRVEGCSLLNMFFSRAFVSSLPHSSITYLDLTSSLRGPKEAIRTLFTCLPDTSLKELHLGVNRINDTDLEPLCRNLQSSKLETLALFFNEITDVGLSLLSKAMVGPKLKYLDVGMNKITGANDLGKHLRQTKIEVLHLGSNKIKKKDMFMPPDFLQGSCVTQLYVDNCGLPHDVAYTLLQSLQFSEVTKLEIRCTKLKPQTVADFASILKETKISELIMSGCDLSMEALKWLGDAMKESRLKRFSKVGSLFFLEDSAPVLAFASKIKDSTLDFLDFSGTNLQNDIEVFATSLQNTTITRLHLSCCRLGPKIKEFISLLKNTAIVELKIDANQLGNQGALKLAAILNETKISDLSVENNDITNKGAEALVQCFKSGPLYQLSLENNCVTEKGMEKLAEMIDGTYITKFTASVGFEEPVGLPIIAATWRNKLLVHQLVSCFEKITSAEDNAIQFKFNLPSNEFINECLQFYKAASEKPSAISVLAHIEGMPLSRDEVANLVLEEFPTKFVSFIASEKSIKVAQRIILLERAEELGLNKIVDELLEESVALMIDEKEGILHPSAYKLLHKRQEYVTSLEQEIKEKVTRYFAEHSDIDGASELVELFKDSSI